MPQMEAAMPKDEKHRHKGFTGLYENLSPAETNDRKGSEAVEQTQNHHSHKKFVP